MFSEHIQRVLLSVVLVFLLFFYVHLWGCNVKLFVEDGAVELGRAGDCTLLCDNHATRILKIDKEDAKRPEPTSDDVTRSEFGNTSA